MSTLKVDSIVPILSGSPLSFQTNNTTRMILTSAGTLSGVGATVPTISNFNGLGQVLSVQSKSTPTLVAFGATWVNLSSELYPFDITVTPQSSSSKFMLYFTAPVGAWSQRVYMRFVRDSTPIGVGGGSGSRLAVNGATYMGGGDFDQMAGSYLDSPATASQIVYHVEVYCNSGNGYLNRSAEDADSTGSIRGTANFTLMEIAG